MAGASEFKCPLCGSPEFDHVRIEQPLGSITFGSNPGLVGDPIYSCSGCSIVFTDPVKFTAVKINIVENAGK